MTCCCCSRLQPPPPSTQEILLSMGDSVGQKIIHDYAKWLEDKVPGPPYLPPPPWTEQWRDDQLRRLESVLRRLEDFGKTMRDVR